MIDLFCFGFGYSARALADAKRAEGWRIAGTVRSAEKAEALRREGFEIVPFDGSAPDLEVARLVRNAARVLASIPPGRDGDPALRRHKEDIAAARPRWTGYLSTIGVYGDRGGDWVDEESEISVPEGRLRLRVEAEAEWRALDPAAHVFRLGGIYGPGRNALLTLSRGEARRIVKPGQVFNRIHVADIAAVLAASMERSDPGRIYNVVDGSPSSPEEPVLTAAELLGVAPPPAIAFEEADLSAMARAFYSANRRVRNERIQSELGVRLAYPTCREGLRALYAALIAEGGLRPASDVKTR